MKRRIVLTAIVAIITCAPLVAAAVGLQAIVPADCNAQGGCSSICDIATLAQNLLNDGIYIAIFLSAILFAWAGWQMVVGSSSGNENQIHKAKNIFWYVTIGLVVILSAWIIVSVIMSAVTNLPNWNAICAQQ